MSGVDRILLVPCNQLIMIVINFLDDRERYFGGIDDFNITRKSAHTS